MNKRPRRGGWEGIVARQWTPQQAAIFDWFKGSAEKALLARARAGTGKTSSIVEALNHAPETRSGSVLLCAFNKRIQEELEQKAPRGVEVKTLHALGFAAVRNNWGRVRPDEKRGKVIAEEMCGRLTPSVVVNAIAKLASLGKLTLTTTAPELEDLGDTFDCLPSDALVEEGWTAERYAAIALACMEQAARQSDVIDFDDMLWVPYRRKVRASQFDLVVVDEAQDMNAAQLALARSALRPGGRIVVVGDDRQALYGFQGADAQAIDRMKRELGAAELPLTTTFRCPRRVVDVARYFVPDYQAAEGCAPGEARWSDLREMARSAKPGDFVLSRSNAGAVEACLRLLRRGTRAQVLGRDIGTGLLKLVDALDTGGSMVAFLERVRLWSAEEQARAKALDKPARAERAADQEETLACLSEGLSSVRELRDRVRDLFTDAAGSGRVTCSTVHKAKGLETDVAWVLTHTFRQARAVEEDNIRYVAATRARVALYLVEREDKPRDDGFGAAMEGVR